jgi:hypothetical protein
MVVVVFDSYMGKQKIAVEKYWYCLREHPLAGVKLYAAAVYWAKAVGCSHLLASASCTSDRYERAGKFLEQAGARVFETTYITELN